MQIQQIDYCVKYQKLLMCDNLLWFIGMIEMVF